MLTTYHTADPVADAERYTHDTDEYMERFRKPRLIKCTAVIWYEVEHATDEEALEIAEGAIKKMLRGAYDKEIVDIEED